MKSYSVVGRRVTRTDSLEKVTGTARYTADLSLPRMLFGKILRSPYAHARIINIDTSRAEKVLGVKAVVTGKQIIPYKLGVFKQSRDQYLLPINKVRYVGEEVVGIAAIDEDAAEEAVSLINVEYEELPVVLDPFEAMKEGAPQLHGHAEQNIGAHAKFEFGDVDDAFQNCDHIYEERIVNSKISHLPMEPYAVLASYRPAGKLDVWLPNQSPFTKRRALSGALGIPLAKIRVHHINIGGGFGGRSDTFPGEFIAALLSMRSNRPVKIVYSREESIIATRQKHSAIVELKLAVNRDGTIIGKDSKVILDGGAYMSSGMVATYTIYVLSEAIYRVANQRYEGIRVYTNKTPCSMQRTHGCQYVVAEEALLDRIAEDLSLDPIELRLKHAHQANDVLPSGSKITSYALGESIEKAVEASEWRAKRGRLPPGRGIGVACSGAFAGFNLGFRLNSSALIKFNEDGSCTLFSGNVDNGQGNESMMIQTASEVLGIPMEDIVLVCADSELTPQDPGNYPMLAAYCSANAVRLAALDARKQILETASQRIEVPTSELDVQGSRVFVKANSDKGMRVDEVVRLAFLRGSAILGKGSFTPEAQSEYGWAVWPAGKVRGQHGATYTPGTTVAEVEVDLETGVVRVVSIVQAYDCGFAINPMAVEGQWEGVAVQMMGETLCERLLWNKKGLLLTSSLLDYTIPTSMDMPEITPIIVESADPIGPFGAKEAGIAGGAGVEAAIVNGIYDAVGVRLKELPADPEYILKALERKVKE